MAVIPPERAGAGGGGEADGGEDDGEEPEPNRAHRPVF